MKDMPCYASLTELRSGSYKLDLLHPKTRAPMMTFRFEPGSGSVAKRAILAYHSGAGDADCFMHVIGMSDEMAFKEETWS